MRTNQSDPAWWRLFVDTGGTFTDAIAVSPDGEVRKAKVLTSGAIRGTIMKCVDPRVLDVGLSSRLAGDVLAGCSFRLLKGGHTPVVVDRYETGSSLLHLEQEPGLPMEPGDVFEISFDEDAPLVAARLLLNRPRHEPLPGLSMRLGTTLATNALLTRSGAPCVLVITRGFGDLLEIGTQQRPHLFALHVEKPPTIHSRIVEVSERLASDGSVIAPLDVTGLAGEAKQLLGQGVTQAAVAFLHSDRNPDHERRVAEFLRAAGFAHVSCSSDMASSIKILPRAMTAVVDAHLSPVVKDYLDRIDRAVRPGRLRMMTSAGGLVDSATARPKDLLLSGPAGGVVGAALAGRASGANRILSFDMGGTSTDVARYDHDFDYVFEHTVGAGRVFAPALSMETVAAGGGSILDFDGAGLKVGPESAGAFPGPACYKAGGPLTVTDANLLLGRLAPENFSIPINAGPSRDALRQVKERLEETTGEQPGDEELLEGFLALANERMAEAIRRISIRRGYDPTEHALVVFGGAGGQHACEVARRLGVDSVIVPGDAGILSAWGLSTAVVERFAEEQLLEPLHQVEALVRGKVKRLAERALSELATEGIPRETTQVRRRIAEVRFQGQESTLQVEIDESRSLDDLFSDRYRDLYGHEPGGREKELVSLRVVVSSQPPRPGPVEDPGEEHAAKTSRRTRTFFNGAWVETAIHDREELLPGAVINGPALVVEEHSATLVEPGWRLTVDSAGALVLRAGDTAGETRSKPRVVELELFCSRFESIAREMGEALRCTAVSTNIKERLDYSCALLDDKGTLVVNAPHIPVHLGSLGMCVRKVSRALPLGPGDMAVTNHPDYGGSHLPDITVIAPVHTDNDRLVGHVAARAHHAEIGGILPGSMPPSATCLSQEGVVIPPLLIQKGGAPQWDALERLLAGGEWPTRALEDNLADLKAAKAACHRGSLALSALAAEHGPSVVSGHMDALKHRAAERMREALSALPDRRYHAVETMDDGTPLEVRIDIAGCNASIDFTGTAPVHPGNLNATPAIVHSVVLYVLRLLVKEELPLNEGLLDPVEIIIPPGLLNPPFPTDPAQAPSIVGGNTETSQRLVDLMIKALGLCAASQGTMNNLVLGNDSFSFYETLCGGSGAGPGFHGASAVHTHMTNTSITDPEILEHRFPVRLERFSLRHGSGGKGRYTGGLGVEREIAFLQEMELSLLSQRRNEGPFGMDGGVPGKPGRQFLLKSTGERVEIRGIDTCRVEPGDRLIIKTPGGGGYGKPPEDEGEQCISRNDDLPNVRATSGEAR